MAATRKLQGEIDRCLKKVTEGVETFEDIWQKVHNATNSNQKYSQKQEKYEADLKKEIKKLQRLRDQIKSWIASAEIKDKSALLENRRLIETQMERFKVVERETKTKAYSKEGLGAAQKLDPAQRVKDEIRSWLTTSISALQLQIDQYESEIESLLAGKKKRLDRDKQDRMDELRTKLDRHKFHITKLETLLRLLDNDGVEVDQVRRIKDDVEYYIDSSQEPDFEENEYIYDDIIGLDEVELSGTGIPSSATTDSQNSNETGGSPPSSISGTSPVQSPLAMNCSNANNLNYSSDSTSVEFTAADKRNKNENNASSTRPVKPTAVRATPKADSNSNSSSTTSSSGGGGGGASSSEASSTGGVGAAVATSSTQKAGTTPSKNQSHSLTTITTAATNLTSTALQPHQQTIVNNTAISVAALSLAAASSSTVTATVQQAQSTVIPATPPIAFAAVAKNTHLENGPIHPGTTYTMAAIAAAAATSPIAVSSLSETTITTQLTNPNVARTLTYPTSSSGGGTLPASALPPIVTDSSSLITSSSQSLTSNNSGSIISSSGNTIAVAVSGGTSAINSITNCVSPNTTMNSTNSRGSPGLISPKLQQINGPTLQKIVPLTSSSVTVDNGGNNKDAMSTLKTMAQEAVNRAAVDSNVSLTAASVDSRQVVVQILPLQQQQQQSGQQSQQQQSIIPPQQGPGQHFSPAVTDAIANNSNTTAANGPSLQHQQQQQQIPPGSVQQATSGKPLSAATNEAHIPPLLGVAPLGPSPLNKEHQLQFQMMETAFYHLPTPSDSEKLTTYLHRQPIPTPAYYPQTQLPHSDSVEFYQRLSTETLFFVFYYMEGTKAQYLAAKALKKQSWRFHTKYMMWFQRHEEPKIINDDYEQGTYIYFDYEKWGQRKKEGFTFEYKYLEDKDLN